ncbi:BON domain-containing protein [Conchiformibius steedae DSM 2580]|uniref:BON domain-containing protein n=2 Tax=Conchiformibius steedae TaxID=153493 RepID=A0A3P2A2X7_9NEIS|nr:BON domain-containing protein [Conchiformibius steedae]QMT33607.1 BON domain-containing protein [Conchiformibius steedae]RRD89335.1 BON domain-containing protein [Conchiformibius steedae]URD68265.1 BON domain-containing protein [Conchiformibius steedae DSM 2580]
MRPWKTGLRTAILGTLIAAALSGCAAAVIGGGLAASSITDRRSAGSQADDQVMELHVKSKAQSILRRNSYGGFKPSVAVVSYNRRLLLLGQVASQADRQTVERIARAERSAAAVFNHISVVPNARTVADVSNDTSITARVRANLLNVPGVYPGHVKVVTYAGVTYVMGMLSPEQQAAVNQRVSTTPGVMSVVTLYENFTESPY